MSTDAMLDSLHMLAYGLEMFFVAVLLSLGGIVVYRLFLRRD